ncbi:double-stranded beta-helix domain protein [Methanocella conradii HZ254]|uniref:Double-stranded beta-helix domain protein n=1 Tax=Methanocella conradii (strain DSM 24694 / JCM 17849 / CGMCC 1.5162 / HZ254) TaxID=1041930 RepID=H8I8Z6_METCZ|nr:cupin domain-containing protein [Methanocella conradii]AFD00467.1 double-stranded beta-helix domain protein [Methanocella conradii HZ254]MDI6895714.1 cupin domain-containing protein [Methanocella conradii]
MAVKKVSGKESLLGKALRLGELVGYQEGSVVSREVINKKTGTVTIFAFDEGEGLSTHSAPFDAMLYVVEGEAEVTIDDNPSKLKAGDFIIMPANHPHAVKALKKFKMLLIMIRSKE